MPDRLAQVCAQFEALMLKQMLIDAGVGRSASFGRSADSDDDDGGDIGGGAGADMMQSMFVDALAQAVAGSDHSGLAHVLETSLRGISK
jgi:Rod binding domain-containing protein